MAAQKIDFSEVPEDAQRMWILNEKIMARGRDTPQNATSRELATQFRKAVTDALDALGQARDAELVATYSLEKLQNTLPDILAQEFNLHASWDMSFLSFRTFVQREGKNPS